MAPLIAVTTSLIEGDPARPQRVALNAAYIRAVEHAGGLPLLLPPYLSESTIAALLERADGVLLTGGGDVDPARYGEERHASVSGVSAARDSMEFFVARQAIERERPVLLICRGMQVFNVAMGGSLFQDIDIRGPKHRQDEARHETSHAVRIAPGSRLASIVGADSIRTNSMHHQAVKVLAPGVVPVAWAEDAVVEGIEMPGYASWLVGVQWHPEELSPHGDSAVALFRAFIQASLPERLPQKSD